MHRHRAARATIAAMLAAIALVAGCGGDDQQAGSPDVRANGTDVAFEQAMIPQNEAAVDAADLALSRAQHTRLRRRAQDIIQAQSTELASLRIVRDVLQDSGVEKGDLGLSEAEQGMGHDPSALRDAADFDCAFLELMIPNREGAIRMARAELAAGIHAELRRMSEIIVDEQGAAVRQMRREQRMWC
jgi:uncharacterized protein (DUF305 family)